MVLVAGPVVCVQSRARPKWRWYLLGIASWALALCVKFVVQVGLDDAGASHLAPGAQGAIGGVLSAAAELGTAAIFLRRRDLRGGEVVAFGVGIGAFEVLFVLALGAVTAAGDASPAGWGSVLAFAVERGVTLVGHVASRVLVHVALRRRAAMPALIAFAAFAAIDGAATYGHAALWDWDSARVLVPFYSFIAAVGAIEAYYAWRTARDAGLDLSAVPE